MRKKWPLKIGLKRNAKKRKRELNVEAEPQSESEKRKMMELLKRWHEVPENKREREKEMESAEKN